MAWKALTALAAVACVSVLIAPTIARSDVAPGKPVPEFTAATHKGTEIRLADFKGKVVVLEWTNEGCPYVRKHYGAGNMQALQRSAIEKGVVWLTVQSSAPGTQGHVNGLEAEKWLDEQKAQPSAFLLDPEGRLGRLFGARTTPHMYVIGADGKLVYSGAIDDRPTANPADIKGARNYVSEALAAIAAGQPVRTASTRAYGCSVKYAEPRS